MLHFRHPAASNHDPTAWLAEHPDTPDRIRAIESLLSARDWAGAEVRIAPAASGSELALVHTPELRSRIQALCAAGGGEIDGDTYVSACSYEAALHAAGGATAMVRALLSGEDRVGFSGLRPSGHHATPKRAMGFCLFNNVAVAAELAVRELGLKRVAIIDWDVHHGNGTAAVFSHRPDVLYTSIHQQGLYPWTGSASESGCGEGYGYTVNLPVQAGSDGDLWLSMLEHVLLPVVIRFEPQLILISAGFDAHRLDPLGGCRLESEDFAQLAAHVREAADLLAVPVGAVLEGGYHVSALAESVLGTLRGLAGEVTALSVGADPYFTPRAASRLAGW
ncbi:MAG: histone deacetylase, partial [Solirubrobacterales bacterium]|nr:histone deacetylase [Solirubrobacterales bacterium]